MKKPPVRKKPVAFSMERGERVQHLRGLGLTFREIAQDENLSVSRVFNILNEYRHRRRLIAKKHWTYGLSTRAQGVLYAYDILGMEELKSWVTKHGPAMPYLIKGVGPKIYTELTEFVASKATTPPQ